MHYKQAPSATLEISLLRIVVSIIVTKSKHTIEATKNFRYDPIF